MFGDISVAQLLVLLVVFLFLLGPERLPEAVTWVGKSIRKAKKFAHDANEQLRQDLGPEFEEFRKPLEEINSLRNLNPKRAVRQHIFDGDSDPLDLQDTERSRRSPKPPSPRQNHTLAAGERPPIDPDAT